MTEEQLFEWPEPTRRRREPTPREEPKLVPRPPGYHAIANRRGVVGFHRTKITAEMSKYGACQTYCGIVGRRVPGVFPKEIPLCDECETEYQKR